MLERSGREVHLTAEPTTGPVGALIRQAFSGRVPLDDRVIAALFVADRIDHLTNEHDGVLAYLEQGIDVISDRYYLSSLAYHSGDVNMDWVSRANELSTDLLRPDITIYLDLDPELAFARLQQRTERADKFEVLDRLVTAHQNYERAISVLRTRDQITIVPADGDPDEIFGLISAALDGWLPPLETVGKLDSHG